MGGGTRLPYDAEVEYLESTGSEYIDTGIIINDTCGFYCSFMGLNRNDKIVLGVKGNSGDSRWCLSGDLSPKVNLSWNTHFSSDGLGLRKIQTAKMNYLNDRISVLNDVRLQDITQKLDNSVANYNVCLFAGHWGSAAVTLFSVVRIYFFQITKGQDVIFDAFPVRVGQVGYMYDRVSGQLFGNAGTGDFVLGPDVSN